MTDPDGAFSTMLEGKKYKWNLPITCRRRKAKTDFKHSLLEKNIRSKTCFIYLTILLNHHKLMHRLKGANGSGVEDLLVFEEGAILFFRPPVVTSRDSGWRLWCSLKLYIIWIPRWSWWLYCFGKGFVRVLLPSWCRTYSEWGLSGLTQHIAYHEINLTQQSTMYD